MTVDRTASRHGRPGLTRPGAPGRALVLVAAVAASAVLCGCGQGGTRAGTALAFAGPVSAGLRAFPPGAAIGYLSGYIENTSGAPVTIDALQVPGSGLGATARVTQVELAPVATKDCPRPAPPRGVGSSCGSKSWVPESAYVSDPPVYWFARGGALRVRHAGCYLQPLRPAHGFILRPHHWFRIWVVVQMLRPGRWKVADHVVYYTQGGTRYRQPIALAYSGSVSRTAKWPRPDLEQSCMTKLAALGSRALDPGHR